MKTYRKERKKYLARVDHTHRRRKFHVCVLGVMAVAIIGYLSIFTIEVKGKDAKAARQYVVNYSEQRGLMLEKEISSGKMAVSSLKESIAHIENPLNLETFLDRKKSIYNFDFIALCDSDTGEKVSVGTIPEEIDLEAVQKNMAAQLNEDGCSCAASIENGSIIYAVLLQSSENTSQILFAGRDTDEIRDMITTESFDGKSSSFIIDTENHILLSSKTTDRSEMWNYVLRQKQDKTLAAEARKMEENLTAGQSGMFEIRSYEHERYYLAYTATEDQEWTVITIIPSDLLAGFSDQYVMKILISLLGTLFLFGIYSVLLLKSYEKEGKQLEHLALLDHVTGGINRIEFRLLYEQLCRKQIADQYAIVLLDSVDFKRINEAFGVIKGDEMLRHFYEAVVKELETKDGEFAARTEMDHIFICLKEHDPERIQKRMQEIIERINDFQGTQLPQCRVAFRLGVCLVENNTTEITTIQDRARLVLKLGTAKNNTCTFYDTMIEQKLKKERELESLFELSLENGEFQVYMQPQVSLTKGKIVGAEALVRWNRPGIGVIPPNEFIPILEGNGKISVLDQYVFERVCRWISDRQQQGKPFVPVAVNLSRSNFSNSDFVGHFAKIAEQYGVDKRWLEFEVTETLFLDAINLEKVREGIQKMHQYGFRCAIDDFGVGFSSLTLLRKFDIDVLKLDRAFFLDLSGKKARNIVRCIADLAKSLEIVLVAEGIETKEQIDFLKTLQCDIVQGYYFSRPLPVEEFEKWMQEFESMDFFEKYGIDNRNGGYTGGGYTDAESPETDQTVL